MKDYYKILGVEKKASKDEIKKAFRTLAHEYHPDKKTGNAEKFKEVNEAYSVLSDDNKRAQYDAMGSGAFNGGFQSGFNGAQGFDFSQFASQFGGGFGQGGVEFDLGDIFGEMFGGGGRSRRPARGTDIQAQISIPFKDSIFGAEKQIRLRRHAECDTCKGSGGEPGTKMNECPTCKGQGKVREMRRTILGQIASERVCDTCGGSGTVPEKACHTCKGKGILNKDETIALSIPAGLDSGAVIRMSGLGEAIKGGQTGDLYIGVHVEPHPKFRKSGANLVADFSVKLSDALLGAEVPFETLDGTATVSIPEGTQFGDILRIKDRGVPQGKKRGDILLTVKIEMPKKLSKGAKKKIEELKEEGL